MIKNIDVDFSNISNNISSMNKPLKLSAKLIRSLEEISTLVVSLRSKSVVRLEINGSRFQLPSEFVSILVSMAEKAKDGSEIQIIGTSENLTTQQAADYLGYSRPTLIKLLDEYKIPISLVGKHRKIQFSDVIRLENKIKAERKKFLDDMALEDYELGRLEGFDPVKNARR